MIGIYIYIREYTAKCLLDMLVIGCNGWFGLCDIIAQGYIAYNIDKWHTLVGFGILYVAFMRFYHFFLLELFVFFFNSFYIHMTIIGCYFMTL